MAGQGATISASNHQTWLERRGPVAWLVIDSPANRNALGGPVMTRLVAGLREALDDPAVRVVVVTGAGHVFSSGADMRDTTDFSVIETAYRDLFKGILEARKPVVARVNGACFGGAIGLAAVCDLSVAVDSAVFSFSEVRLGRTATLASVVSLPKLRKGEAANLLLRGNRIDGTRAAELGLVDKAVSSDELDAEVDAIVADLLAAGPVALANTKRLIREVALLDEDAAWDLAFQITRETAGSPEAVEGTAAFREKRPPVWPAA